MERKLVPELWLSVGKCSDKCDLNALSRTSKYLLDILRPQLYQTVDLRRNEESSRPNSPMDTLFLLSRDLRLAACVRELHIGDDSIRKSASEESLYTIERCVNPFLNALPYMTSLRSLQMHTWYFNHPKRDVHTPLLRILQSDECPIRNFYIQEWSPFVNPRDEDCFLRGMQIFKCHSFIRIPHENYLVWYGEWRPHIYGNPIMDVLTEQLLKPLFGLTVSSQETLHTLHLPIYVTRESDRSLALWNARFPHLRHLSVFEWGFSPEDIDESNIPLLRDFLLSHQDLLISVVQIRNSLFSSAKFTKIGGKLGFAFICLNSTGLDKPIMSRPRPDFLKTLHTLEMEPCHPDNDKWRLTGEMYRMLFMVRNNWGLDPGPVFHAIRHLALTHVTKDEEWALPNPNDVLDCIHDFGLLCGTELQSITVSLPLLTFSKNRLAIAFSAYPSVEEVTIRGGLLEGYPSKSIYRRAAKIIASRCQNLRKLHFKNFDEVVVDRPNVSLRIERGREDILVYIESID